MCAFDLSYEGESAAILRAPLRFDNVKQDDLLTKPQKPGGGDPRSRFYPLAGSTSLSVRNQAKVSSKPETKQKQNGIQAMYPACS